MSDEIVELEREAGQARENLSRTLDEVNRKATATAHEILAPEQPIRRYPIAALCGAMALGMAAGGMPKPAVLFGILALGGVWILHPDPPAETSNGTR
jgi:hypothetical protein